MKRPCLNYHIKRCSGPCVYANKVRIDYHQDVQLIIEFLKGHQKTLLKTLNEQMATASEKLDFEKAIDLRDRIEAIRFLQIEQKVVNTKAVDQDIIGTYVNDDEFCIAVFFVREGKMIDRQNFIFDLMTDFDYSEIIRTFMTQFYTDTSFIPKEILVEQVMEDQESLENYLSRLAEKKIRVVTPLRGNKFKLIKMVNLNAKEYLEKNKARFNQQKVKYQSIVEELNALISLGEIHRIEAYDISNIYGVFNVGTMVVYEDGKKKKNDYRKFKIRSVKKADDYASMREVMDRRFARLVDEFDEASFSKWPNLILLDGGKGQVSTVTEVMESYGLEIPVIGMVKDDHHRTRGLVKGTDVYELKPDSQLYKFIYEIQEEVHRFAIDYHRTLRTKSVTGSLLDDIPGIGKKRREDLLKHFGNITRIQNATIEELTAIPSINEKTANVIKLNLKVSKK